MTLGCDGRMVKEGHHELCQQELFPEQDQQLKFAI